MDARTRASDHRLVFCPKCGKGMGVVDGTFVCVSGEMHLSQNLHGRLCEVFVSRTRSARPMPRNWGGSWFCPGCGVAAVTDHEHVRCNKCGQYLDEFLHQLIEHHPHRSLSAFYVANGLGDSIESPSPDQMRAFLDALDPNDEEHGAAWLSTDDRYSLEWSVDGRLVLEAPDYDRSRHLLAVSRERAVDLWCALARGDIEYVRSQPWADGNGFVLTAEKRAELEEWQLASDREFYDSLGVERQGTRCRHDGCIRGAVELSVHCRVHHFESVNGKRCPFDH